uniref:Uncharacterized protein n=1 Tax=Romanomermis culicivorax TaxID=13658 RepID=A0A915INN8_ROMCU
MFLFNNDVESYPWKSRFRSPGVGRKLLDVVAEINIDLTKSRRKTKSDVNRKIWMAARKKKKCYDQWRRSISHPCRNHQGTTASRNATLEERVAE